MEHDNLFSFSDLPNSFDVSRQRTLKRRDFITAVETAIQGGKKDRDLKIERLDAIAAQGVDDLSSAKLMRLYTAYMDLHAFDRMITLYKKAENKDFKDAPMVREELAVAYRKIKRGDERNPDVLANKMFDYKLSMQISQDLINEGHGYGVSYENIGRCNRYIAQRSTGFQADQYYANSLFALEEGFARTLESSVGIQAVHANILAGNTDKAHELAKVVYLATLRDGAEESNDYFCTSAALQVACIADVGKKEIEHLCGRLENTVTHLWELPDILRDLEKIGEGFPSPSLALAQKRLKAANERRLTMDKMPKARAADTGASASYTTWDKRSFAEDPKLCAVIEKSYSYRGCGSAFRGANRISGNMAFGGQLPDHAVSRKDLRLFEGLVAMSPNELGIKPDKPVKGVDMDKPMTDIRDPEAFIQLADRFIRQTFSTESFANSGLHMENNAFDKDPKTGESLYDTTVKSVLQATGKVIGERDKNVDSRTNISAIFALGMGDCRHHAQVKQIMFDTWQKKQMDASLQTMCRRVLRGGRIDKDDHDTADFYSVLDTEMRTADIQVMMPVKMQQKDGKDQLYKPEKTADGKYIVDESGKNHSLEEHTLCWLIRKNRSHKLVSFGIRDAFYQQLHYPWAKMDVNIDDIRLNKNGNPIIPAGQISGDKTSTGKSVPVMQYPAVYNSGKRDSFIKDTTGRDINLVGLPMAGFKTPQDFLKMIKDREGMFAIMAQVRAKAAERAKTKDIALLKKAKMGVRA